MQLITITTLGVVFIGKESIHETVFSQNSPDPIPLTRPFVPQKINATQGDYRAPEDGSGSSEATASTEDRAYARYELAYRKAFGLRYVLHPETGAVVVFDMSNKSATARKLDEIEAAEARVKVKAAAIRRAHRS